MSEINRETYDVSLEAGIAAMEDTLESVKAALDMAQTKEQYQYTLDQYVTLDRQYRQMLNRQSYAQWSSKIMDAIQNVDTTKPFLSEVIFSEPLKAALDQYRTVQDAVVDAAINEFSKIQTTDVIDVRDFNEMVGTELSWDAEYGDAYVRNYVRDYFSGSEGRTRTLNEFYDRLDAVDAFSLDFSCLQGTDNGPRSGPDNLTQSERDFLKLYSLFHANQTLGVKAQENPGYLEARYPTPQAMAHFELTQDLLITRGFNNYMATVPLINNGYSESLHKLPAQALMPLSSVAPTVAMQVYRQHMATLHGVEADRSLKFSIPKTEAKGLYNEMHPQNGTVNLASYCTTFFEPIHGSDAATRYMRETGTTMEDMFFIDGKSLRELGAERYPNETPESRNHKLRNDMITAMLSGEHRIEVAAIQLDPGGNYAVKVSAIQPDLHCFDEIEKSRRSIFRRAFDFGLTKIETTGSKADKLWANDPEREARQNAIRENLAGRILAETNYKLRTNLRHEENQKTFAELNKQTEIAHSSQLQDLIARDKAAKQTIDDIASRNIQKNVRIGELVNEQKQVDNYLKAVRRNANIIARIDTLNGVTNDDTDFYLPHLDSLLESIPSELSGQSIRTIKSIANKKVKPAFLNLEFALDLSAMPELKEKATYMLKNSASKNFSEKELEILCGDDAERKEALLEDLREKLRAPLRELTESFTTSLNSLPVSKLASEELTERRAAEIAELKAQLIPVSKEQRIQKIEAEAAILDGRELYEDDITKDHLYQGYPQGYKPPETRQEALDRIAEIDARNDLYNRHYEERVKVENGKFLLSGGFDHSKPAYEIMQDVKDTLEYMNSLNLPIDKLPPEMQSSFSSTVKNIRLLIETQSTTAKVPDHLDNLMSAYFRMCTLAVDSKPEYASLDVNSSAEINKHHQDMHTRQCLMENLRDFGKEERLIAMAEERKLTYPPVPAKSAIDLDQLSGQQRTRSNSVSNRTPQPEAQQAKQREPSNSF